MKIGKAVFKQDATKRAITPEIQALISNDNFWAIDHKKYQKQNWTLIFSEIQEITVSTLILDYNCHKNILSQINHIKFYHLKEIWLRQNKISNIEELQNLQAPFLELLRISMNYIVKFKPLVKVQSRLINQIYIPANPINDLQSLCRTRLNSQMNDIFLEYWSHNNVIAQDLSFIVKFNSKSIHDLWVKGDTRIQQPKTYKAINRKLRRLNIYKKDEAVGMRFRNDFSIYYGFLNIRDLLKQAISEIR